LAEIQEVSSGEAVVEGNCRNTGKAIRAAVHKLKVHLTAEEKKSAVPHRRLAGRAVPALLKGRDHKARHSATASEDEAGNRSYV
jgi:hypothetical protein